MTAQPETHTYALAELIRAHRAYVGITQYDMAARLGKNRRDYQRIEKGQDPCPPGMLTKVEAISDEFAHDVDALINEADRRGGLTVEIVVSDPPKPREAWHRLVAGRAAVEANDGAPITLTIVGEHHERRAG